ncbi:MAG: single-stranded DNA-binding protein [Campylobacterales bacterium]|nr:single-stranded DNA-binding protein [Campylobacterales bacterium]
MFNKIILVGNLTRDIELKYAQGGSAIANTAIATSRKFTVNGEKKEETCFVDITFFGRSGEVANQYLRKGSKILVEGRLKFDQWVDQASGQKRSKHSVIVETMQMLDSRGEASQGGGSNNYDSGSSDNYSGGYDAPAQKAYTPPPSYNKPPPVKMPENNLPEIDINEDEIPF